MLQYFFLFLVILLTLPTLFSIVLVGRAVPSVDTKFLSPEYFAEWFQFVIFSGMSLVLVYLENLYWQEELKTVIKVCTPFFLLGFTQRKKR